MKKGEGLQGAGRGWEGFRGCGCCKLSRERLCEQRVLNISDVVALCVQRTFGEAGST